MKKTLWILLVSAFIFRLGLSFFGTLPLDFNTFLAWSGRLIQVPFNHFYQVWCDYTPGYLYFLFLLAKIKAFFSFLPTELLYKLPAIVADILTGVLIYQIVKRLKGEKMALWATFFYLFNPAVFANSALWGQVDSLTIFFTLAAVYFFDSRPWLSAFLLALGTSVKVQAALAVLPILFLAFRSKRKWKKIFPYGFFSFLIFILTFLPFAGSFKNLLPFVVERLKISLSQYPYLSVNAFNFWALGGFWRPDQGILRPSLLVAFLPLALISVFSFLKLKKTKGGEYLVLALAFGAAFLFFPRMHERHILPTLAPLLISSTIFFDLWPVYFLFSLFSLFNLYYSFIWITQDFKTVFSDFFIKGVVLTELFLFAFWLKTVFSASKNKLRPWLKKMRSFLKTRRKGEKKAHFFTPRRISSRRAKLYLILILVFGFLTRIYRLSLPPKEYFDEVYHAFTAKLMLEGDPKAWEWWNPHPKGYAYEWSHPPLAKLGMQLGMKIFGENAFGWRLPAAILGTLTILMVYLLAKEIFQDELAALFSALALSLDGLFLVMSRIGMNDIYLLFFLVLCLYLFLKDRLFLSALAFGLALASKWTAFWLPPVLVAAFLAFNKKLKPGYVWFFILPPLVYLASYAQMFLTGHNLDIFIGVQKQMWWYHTGLKATHPYTSSWWSWPLLIRPIWLYTESFGQKVANIYAFGNPLIFWVGVFAILFLAYYAYHFRARRLGWVVFAYLALFVPWAFSPRIMFFYHYLPAIPFLSLALGFWLRKNLKFVGPFFLLALILFFYFYPHLIGIPVSRALDSSYYWFSSWQ